MIRFLQVFIVLFWLGATSWLVWTVYSPSGSGFTEVNANEPIRLFFDWNENDSMAILDHGKRIGQVTVSGGSGEDDRTGVGFVNTMSMTGSLNGNAFGQKGNEADAIVISWRVAFEFDDAEPMNLLTADVVFREPRQGLSMVAKFTEEDETLRVQATKGEQVLFRFSGNPNETPVIPEVLTSGFLKGVLDNLGDPTDIKPQISASRGTQEFGGRELPVFLLKIGMIPEQEPIKVFISTAGEPLKVDSGLGIEAISEVLVPWTSFQKAE